MNNNNNELKRPLNPQRPKVNSSDRYLTVHQRTLFNDGWPIHAFDEPVEVVNGLWLSGIGFDDDLPIWCHKNGFTHVVNAAGSYARLSHYKTNPNDYNIKYIELDMDDTLDFELQPFLAKMYSFIYFALEKGKKILVHCIWGQSRSVSCVAYFIMTRWWIKYDASLAIIRNWRLCAKPNRNFEMQLRLIDIGRVGYAPSQIVPKIIEQGVKENDERLLS